MIEIEELNQVIENLETTFAPIKASDVTVEEVAKGEWKPKEYPIRTDTPILVCGSRTPQYRDNPSYVTWFERKMMKALEDMAFKLDCDDAEPFFFLSGMAVSGADLHICHLAEKLKIDVEEYPAAWNYYGKKAGMVRNSQMLSRVKELDGVVVAFWDMKSSGTRDTIRKATQMGIEVYLIDINLYERNNNDWTN